MRNERGQALTPGHRLGTGGASLRPCECVPGWDTRISVPAPPSRTVRSARGTRTALRTLFARSKAHHVLRNSLQPLASKSCAVTATYSMVSFFTLAAAGIVAATLVSCVCSAEKSSSFIRSAARLVARAAFSFDSLCSVARNLHTRVVRQPHSGGTGAPGKSWSACCALTAWRACQPGSLASKRSSAARAP